MEDAERRMLVALHGFIEERVIRELDEGRRTLEARRIIRANVNEEVGDALGEAVARLVERVEDETTTTSVPPVRPSVTGRFSVLDNEAACDRCGRVNAVAIIDLQDGEVVAVECEACAPEFRRPRRRP